MRATAVRRRWIFTAVISGHVSAYVWTHRGGTVHGMTSRADINSRPDYFNSVDHTLNGATPAQQHTPDARADSFRRVQRLGDGLISHGW